MSRCLLHFRQISFLRNYRNPCWLEQQLSPNLYLDDNAYFAQLLPRVGKRGREYINSIQTNWQESYANGTRQRVRCLPYYYLAGVTKCGTTALWKDMQIHPADRVWNHMEGGAVVEQKSTGYYKLCRCNVSLIIPPSQSILELGIHSLA